VRQSRLNLGVRPHGQGGVRGGGEGGSMAAVGSGWSGVPWHDVPAILLQGGLVLALLCAIIVTLFKIAALLIQAIAGVAGCGRPKSVMPGPVAKPGEEWPPAPRKPPWQRRSCRCGPTSRCSRRPPPGCRVLHRRSCAVRRARLNSGVRPQHRAGAWAVQSMCGCAHTRGLSRHTNAVTGFESPAPAPA
jgi:hypothetical protein